MILFESHNKDYGVGTGCGLAFNRLDSFLGPAPSLEPDFLSCDSFHLVDLSVLIDPSTYNGNAGFPLTSSALRSRTGILQLSNAFPAGECV